VHYSHGTGELRRASFAGDTVFYNSCGSIFKKIKF